MSIRKIICLIVMLSLFALVACTKPITQFYNGWYVENSAILEDANGTWSTYDVSIKFASVKSQDVLSFAGKAMLTSGYQMSYDHVRFFNVYLFFVDEEMAVLKTVSLVSSVTGTTDVIVDFDVSSEVPQGATDIALGYSGSVYEHDNYTSFVMLPSQQD